MEGRFYMRIVVVGIGKVGKTLADQLTREEHDVVVIDRNEELLQRIEDQLDVLCVRGNGANANTLLEANVGKADIVIATTATDETNMLCCLIAKRLGAKYTIARIRDPEYNESLTLLQQELGIDMTINPERATAQEISRLLRFPFASNIENFARGQVEMVEFRCMDTDPIAGLALKEMPTRIRNLPRVLYAAVERNGEVTIPNGDFVIQAGDRLYVAADTTTMTHFFRQIGRNAKRVRNTMILGGGRVSYYLSRIIAPIGIDVSLIEIDKAKSERLSEMLPDVNVILGDGTDQELLMQAGLQDMDAFVALCDRDEENLMTALYAARQGVPKVVVKNNRLTYADIISSLGLDSIVSTRSITADTILRYVRARVGGGGTAVEKLFRLVGGKAEALEFIANKGDPYIGIPLKNLTMRQNTLVAVIVRRNKIIVPSGNDTIEAGDNVLIITRESGVTDLNEVIRR